MPAPEGGGRQLRLGDRLGNRFMIVQFLTSSSRAQARASCVLDRSYGGEHFADEKLESFVQTFPMMNDNVPPCACHSAGGSRSD